MWIPWPTLDCWCRACWLALVWLGVLGTAFAYIIYFQLLQRIGATRSTMVTYLVALIGVVLGVAIPVLLALFWGMTTIVTPGAPLLAFSISAVIGVAFGIYPSMRAADMDPVEALRHE